MRLVFCFISVNILYKVIFFLFVLSVFLLISGLCPAQSEVSKDSLPIKITEGWQYRWGDSAIDEKGMPLWVYDNMESTEWKPTISTMNPPGRQGHKTLWLRAKLPERQWKGSSLFIPSVFQAFEVYLEDRLIYKFGELKPSGKNKFAYFKWYIIPLEPDFHGKTLAFRIYSDSSQDIGIDGDVILASQANLIKIIMADIDQFILGFLFIFIGLFSIFIFLRRREQKVYFSLSFGVFVFCFGIAMLAQHVISQLLFDAPIVRYYLVFTFAYLFPVGLYASIEQVFGAGYKSIVRRIWQLNIVYAVGALILDIINVVSMPRAMTPFLILVILEIPTAILSTSGAKSSSKENVETKLFMTGFVILAFPPVYDILVGFGLLPAWRAISFHWGLFIFILILGYILERRFSQAHKELESYNRTLEQKVEARTQDLKEKNEALEATMQELKETQNQLVMQEKMASLGNLVAGVAHEVNNPIAAVNSTTDISSRAINQIKSALEMSQTLEDIQNNKRFQRALQILESNNLITATAGDRIAKIVGSLRNFARLDEAEFQKADIHDGIDSTLTLVQHELKNKAEVIKEYGDVPEVYCYPNQLNQVFMNLFVNAAQAIEDKGTITIKTFADDINVYVKISDTGKGIPAENLKRIFDPGFTTKSSGVGTGLGLSISYNIIQKHKGEIKVESEVGKGTEFTIVLQIEQTL